MEVERILLQHAGQITLLAIFIIAVVGLNIALKRRHRVKRRLLVFGTYIACVSFAIASARSVSWYIEERIKFYNPRDLWWLNSKLPAGYEYLGTELTQDTGRAMVFITAPILTPIVMVFAYGIIFLHHQIAQRL